MAGVAALGGAAAGVYFFGGAVIDNIAYIGLSIEGAVAGGIGWGVTADACDNGNMNKIVPAVLFGAIAGGVTAPLFLYDFNHENYDSAKFENGPPASLIALMITVLPIIVSLAVKYNRENR